MRDSYCLSYRTISGNICTWNLLVLYFWDSTVQTMALYNQNNGHLGSRYVCIYNYIYNNSPRPPQKNAPHYFWWGGGGLLLSLEKARIHPIVPIASVDLPRCWCFWDWDQPRQGICLDVFFLDGKKIQTTRGETIPGISMYKAIQRGLFAPIYNW